MRRSSSRLDGKDSALKTSPSGATEPAGTPPETEQEPSGWAPLLALAAGALALAQLLHDQGVRLRVLLPLAFVLLSYIFRRHPTLLHARKPRHPVWWNVRTIAHRGGRTSWPENTLFGFNACCAEGLVGAVELDVSLYTKSWFHIEFLFEKCVIFN